MYIYSLYVCVREKAAQKNQWDVPKNVIYTSDKIQRQKKVGWRCFFGQVLGISKWSVRALFTPILGCNLIDGLKTGSVKVLVIYRIFESSEELS